MSVSGRRKTIVLVSLAVAMALGGVFLRVAEPRPAAPVNEAIMLTALEAATAPEAVLFEPLSPPNRKPWKAIVIHHSGTLNGSARSLNAAHEKMGLGGLGYHFVINNGRGSPDGQIEVGFRWRRQYPGAYCGGTDGDWFNRYAIGVCVIGDPARQAPTDLQVRELTWLIQKLQDRFDIPADRVLIQGANDPMFAGRFFPFTLFRQQLLTPGH